VLRRGAFSGLNRSRGSTLGQRSEERRHRADPWNEHVQHVLRRGVGAGEVGISEQSRGRIAEGFCSVLGRAVRALADGLVRLVALSAVAAADGERDNDTVSDLTARDVRAACDVLWPVFERTGGWTVACPLRLTPVSRLARNALRLRPADSGGWLTDQTSSSKSQQRRRLCRPSYRAWQTASAST
jgi:hypothetical protein